MNIFKTIITNAKATSNINNIIDGLTSEKDIAIANKFVASIKNATQDQRDEIFTFFAKIKGETKEEIQSAFLKRVQSDEVKKVFDPVLDTHKVGSKLNITENKKLPLNKNLDSRTEKYLYVPQSYEQDIRRPGSGRDKTFMDEMRTPGISRDKAYMAEISRPGISSEEAYRRSISGIPRI